MWLPKRLEAGRLLWSGKQTRLSSISRIVVSMLNFPTISSTNVSPIGKNPSRVTPRVSLPSTWPWFHPPRRAPSLDLCRDLKCGELTTHLRATTCEGIAVELTDRSENKHQSGRRSPTGDQEFEVCHPVPC